MIDWLASLDRVTRFTVAIALVLVLVSLVWVEFRSGAPESLHTLQARALLHGRLDIGVQQQDVAVHEGKYFVPFPPFPALLIVPFELTVGPTNTLVIGLIATVIGVLAFGSLARSLGVDRQTTVWLALAFFLGTAYWSALRQSHEVWYLSHVVATTCTLLALRETLVSQRGWAAGLLLGAAFLSRHLALYAGIFVVASLWTSADDRRRAGSRVASFLATFLPCVVLYLAFNAARFGDPLDTGYAHLALKGFAGERVAQHGIFDPAYVVFNAIYMFLQGPHLVFDGLLPRGFDPYGTSLTFASPIVLVALLARGRRIVLWAAWLAVSLCVAHMLLYYNNGWVQHNAQRFSLDFLPVFMVLVMVAAARVPRPWLRGLTWYALAWNALALVAFPVARLLYTGG